MNLLLNPVFLSDMRHNDIEEQQNNCHFYFSVTFERTFSTSCYELIPLLLEKQLDT